MQEHTVWMQPGWVERKASPDKAFGLGLFIRVARWPASLGLAVGQGGRIVGRVHCYQRLGCLVSGGVSRIGS